MTQEPTDVQHALRGFLAGQVSPPQFYRALMRHPTWWVAGTHEQGQAPHLKILHFAHGERRLVAFTDREALEAAREAMGATLGAPLLGDSFLTTEGLGLFRVLEPGLSSVEINPHSEHSLRLEADQITTLRRWAVVARLEATLEDPSREEDPMAVLRRFPWYEVALEGEGQARQMLLAPDAQGRRLAAVFTTQDALELFLAQVEDQLEGRPAHATTAGKELFISLKQLNLDGVVFNCCGPTPPRAFGVGVLDAILAG
jgi:hypothetical protein